MLATAGAIAFSGKAIIVKLSYRYGVDAATIIMYRMLFALPCFLLLGWWSERQAHAKANPLNRADALRIAALGFVGYYLSSYLDFLGLQFITASLERHTEACACTRGQCVIVCGRCVIMYGTAHA